MDNITLLLDRLEKVVGKAPTWRSLCPAHDNRHTRTLKITQTPEGMVLLKCFAGCGGADIMDAIGLPMSDLFPEKDGRKVWNEERKFRDTQKDIERKAFYRELILVTENEALKRENAELKKGKKNV